MNVDVLAAQAGDRGLGRGERGAQVVADRGEQRGAQPVGLGERRWRRRPARRGAPGAARPRPGRRTPRPPAGRRRPADRPRRTRDELVVDRDLDVALAGRQARAVADAGGDPPGVGVALAVRGRRGASGRRSSRVTPVEPERLPELFEQGGQRPAAAQHAAGQGGQRLGLGPGAGRPRGCAGRPGRPRCSPRPRRARNTTQREQVLAARRW